MRNMRGSVRYFQADDEGSIPFTRSNPFKGFDEFVARLVPVVEAIRKTGTTTLEAMSCALNHRGIRSARGAQWHVASVSNLLKRAQKFVEA